MKPARWVRTYTSLCLALLCISPVRAVFGGDIAGIPAPLPPTVNDNAYLDFSNDFLGRGGSTDDFRTQQFKLTFTVSKGWQVLLDHSILTSTEPPAGRIDELALSIGYTLLDRETPGRRDRLLVGSGLRTASEFYGERIQNGFHQLIDSGIEMLPYTDTDEVALSGWLVGETQRNCCKRWPGGLAYGYWLRAASYITTRGQWDTSLGAYLTARNRWLDGWLGLRGEWREGYDDDRVRAATANAESGPGIVFGLRAGPIVLETHQQLDGPSSFGHLGFVIPGGAAPHRMVDAASVIVGFGIRLPDVLLQLESRFGVPFFPRNGLWRETVFTDFRYGKPQYGDRSDLYVGTWQITTGLDLERAVPAGWAPALFARAGIGARREKLASNDSQAQSASVLRAVAVLAAGLRWRSACDSGKWNCSVIAGFEYVLADEPAVTLGDERLTLLGHSASVLLGFELGFR